MSEHEHEFSIKNLFVPLTTVKAIHIIVIVGFIVFRNALFNGFVWDDITYILFNPNVQSLNIYKSIGENLFNTGGHYRPIPAVYFATLYSLFKDSPFFYHFLQVALHIVNTSLLYILFKKFFNNNLSLLLALIFLVHPMQVESVTYIASSGNPLFFLFGITALLLSFQDNITIKRIVFIFGILLLSVLTRETGFSFCYSCYFTELFLRKSTFSFL